MGTPGDIATRTALASVLVVEDNDTTRQRITTLLDAHGFAVTEAVDGRDALNKVLTRPFKVIVLDLVLPHVDGWQFRATQMAHPELARIPTVIVTVQALREPARYALRADNVIRKPFEDADLLALVRRACGVEKVAQQDVRVDGASASEDGRAPLLWSRRGEVACAAHAPEVTSPRWQDEQWTGVPPSIANGRMLYQCQHCARRPLQHRKRERLPSDQS